MASVLAVALWIASLLPFVLVQHQVATALVQAAVLAAIIVLAWRQRHPRRVELLAFSLAWAALYLTWLFSDQRLGLMCAQLVSAGMCIYMLFFTYSAHARTGSRGLAWRIAVGAVIEVCACLLMIPFFDADAFTSIVEGENATEAQRAIEQRADGVEVLHDVAYASDYANSYLDVYRAHSDAPTVVYLHGGEYAFGDKAYERPTLLGSYVGSSSREGFDAYVDAYLDAGYNVVSVNYALTPSYRYPVPLIQLSEAMTYLGQHAGELGLNMDDVVLIGSTNGGNIVGAYALAQSDRSYASWVGLPNDFANGKIRAVVFDGGVFDNARLGATDNWVMDYIGDACVRSYFNASAVDGDASMRQANLIQNTKMSFPPSYISEGDTKGFADQASDFANRLNELGVPYELHIASGEVHGFELSGSAAAQRNVIDQIAFVDYYAK